MMRTVVESPNRPQIDWERVYGSIDGPWLRAEFEHIAGGLDHMESIHVARMDDEIEMARFREQTDASSATFGDWEVSSGTGVRYLMGCTWRDAD